MTALTLTAMMPSLTHSDKCALAFQLVTQLTNLIDEQTFANRIAVLQEIKEAWERNKEVTIVTAGNSYVGPSSTSLNNIVKQEVEDREMPKIEKIVDYELQPVAMTASYTEPALSSMNDNSDSVTESSREEENVDYELQPVAMTASYTESALSSMDDNSDSVTESSREEEIVDYELQPVAMTGYTEPALSSMDDNSGSVIESSREECPQDQLDTESLFVNLVNNRAQVTLMKISLGDILQSGIHAQSPREENGFDSALIDKSRGTKPFEGNAGNEKDDSSFKGGTSKDTDTEDISTSQSGVKTKPYECKNCKQSFKFGEFSAERPFHCPHCQKNVKPREQGGMIGTRSKSNTPVSTITLPKSNTLAASMRPFPCTLCSKRFMRSSHLEDHINRHRNIKQFSCACCSKRFCTATECWSHQFRIHSFNSRPRKLQSKKQTKPPKPEVPLPACLSLSAHSAQEGKSAHASPRVNQWYHCDVCEVKFPAKMALVTHKKRHCSCNVCGVVCSTRVDLRQHQRVHIGKGSAGTRLEKSRPTLASKGIRKKYERLRMNKTSNDIPHHCTKVFLDSDSLSNHEVKLHDDLNRRVISRSKATSRNSHQCTKCLKHFSNKGNLKRHIREVCSKPPVSKKKPALKAGHCCQLCPQTFSTKVRLAKHMQIQHDATTVSGKSDGSDFSSVVKKSQKEVEARHMDVVTNVINRHLPSGSSSETSQSSTKPKFCCKVCKVSLSCRIRLLHHESLHIKNPSLIRKIGENVTPWTGHLTSHRQMLKKKCKKRMPAKRVNVPLKYIYKCQYCGKNHSNRSHLVEHERIHTGEMPFYCATCDTYFRRKSKLNRHLKDKHPEVVPATRTSRWNVVETLQNHSLPESTSQATKACSPTVTGVRSPTRQAAQQKPPSRSDHRSPSKQHSPLVVPDEYPQCQVRYQVCSQGLTFAEKLALNDDKPSPPEKPSLPEKRFLPEKRSLPEKLFHRSEGENTPSVSGIGRRQVYKCGYCGKVGRRKDHMMEHERQHTGEKPFSCDCGKAFRAKSNLRKHRKYYCILKGSK